MGSKRPMPPGGGKFADRRAKFERLSRQSPRDEEAERRGQDGDGAHGSEPDGGGEATRAQGAQTKTAASTAAMSAPCNAGRLTCFLGGQLLFADDMRFLCGPRHFSDCRCGILQKTAA